MIRTMSAGVEAIHNTEQIKAKRQDTAGSAVTTATFYTGSSHGSIRDERPAKISRSSRHRDIAYERNHY
jgi:hypothetical protein